MHDLNNPTYVAYTLLDRFFTPSYEGDCHYAALECVDQIKTELGVLRYDLKGNLTDIIDERDAFYDEVIKVIKSTPSSFIDEHNGFLRYYLEHKKQ